MLIWRSRPATLVGIALLVLVVVGATVFWLSRDEQPPRRVTIEYDGTNDRIANPERGLYVTQYSSTPSGGYASLDVEALRGFREQGYTLVKRYFELDEFVDEPLSEEMLDAIATDFEIAREAGIKLIVRFTYSVSEDAAVQDAPPEVIHEHLAQVGPILHEHGDAIAVVQAGFIGVWGEWAFTDHFSDPYATDVSDRQEILEHLLNAVPDNRFVQVRTPRYKYRMDLSPEQADRVAFHNDCFLRGPTDGGTYREEALEADRAYLATQAAHVPIGGETCQEPDDRFDDALHELALFRWSFLNGGFHPEHLVRWGDEGLLDVIERSLGYRFALLSADLPTTAAPGERITVGFEIQNDGWASPFNPREFFLALRHEQSDEHVWLELEADPREWSPGEPYGMTEEVELPPDLAPGEYAMYLYLPDPAPSLIERPAYAIRFANVDTWEPETGYNRLQHRLDVS